VVAIFGRNTARQRLRRAARESIAIPVFSAPVDCAPWVTGGLWPAELSTITTQTAPLITHLKADLQRIVNDANDELKRLRLTGLPDPVRSAQEARIINKARGFAVRRVESTVRSLHATNTRPLSQYPPPSAAHVDTTQRFKLALPQPATSTAVETSCSSAGFSAGEPPDPAPPTDLIGKETPPSDPDTAEPTQRPQQRTPEAEDTEVIADITSLLHDLAPTTDNPTPPTPRPEPVITPPPVSLFEPVAVESSAVDDTETTPHPLPQLPPESQHERLQRLLKFVARQEPGVRWAIGNRDDGTTLLVTDLAHGWIPPGITLPADVHLLEPARRTGTAMALLGKTRPWVTYAPGDALGWPSDYDATETSPHPRDLPPVDDLGWALGEATQWRDGLPRIVNILAKAGAAGTGVVDAEIDTLRVHLDTSRHQLLAQYPQIGAGLLLNYLLLAATDAMATSDQRNANYHFAWFQTLSAPPRRW
jgi:Family of unknown function (DUF5631)/Family of unknown function (DUF5632)